MAGMQREIHIYDHPQSRVRFLETTLGDTHWRAVIVVPRAQTPNPLAYAQSLEEPLKARGYETRIDIDASGAANLHIHHVGGDLSPNDAMEQMGLVQGVAYSMAHPGRTLSSLIRGSMDYATYLVKDPARLFSSIYLLGDLSYTSSGMFENAKHMRELRRNGQQMEKKSTVESMRNFFKPENGLMTLSGILATAQSLIVMAYASSGGEANLRELKQQYKNGQRQGIDSTHVQGWTELPDKKHLFSPLTDLARRYPIDVGSWTQIAGQAALIGASGFQIANALPTAKLLPKDQWRGSLKMKEPLSGVIDPLLKKQLASKDVMGAGINIMRALVAMSAWAMLMRPAKQVGEEVGWDHPLTHMRQMIEAHPERAAGFLNGVASAIGLAASHIKNNTGSIWAEGIWLAGDAVMMFAKKEHYGEAGAAQEKTLINAGTEFMKQLPLVLSPSVQKKMVTDLANHLARRVVDEREAKPLNAQALEKVTELAQTIADGIQANLAVEVLPYQQLTAACGRLVGAVPDAQREAVLQSLAQGLANAPGIQATPEELTAALRGLVPEPQGKTSIAPATLRQKIEQMLTSAPGFVRPPLAMALYDVVQTHFPNEGRQAILSDLKPYAASEAAGHDVAAAEARR